MLMLYDYQNIRKHLLQIATICIAVFVILLPAYAQDKKITQSLYSFPLAYNNLQTDTAKMRFLVKAITDSLNEDQLTHVYDWPGWV